MAAFMNRKAQLALPKCFIMAASLAILSCLPAMAASLVMLGGPSDAETYQRAFYVCRPPDAISFKALCLGLFKALCLRLCSALCLRFLCPAHLRCQRLDKEERMSITTVRKRLVADAIQLRSTWHAHGGGITKRQ